MKVCRPRGDTQSTAGLPPVVAFGHDTGPMTTPRPPGARSRIAFGPEVGAQLEPAIRREWLVTNALGGYAAGTVAGVPTRVYHGLLVASLRPPVQRRVVVAGALVWLTVEGRRTALHALEHADGRVEPRGFEHLARFELDGARPVWTWELGDVRVEHRVWMAHGANTTYVRWALAPGSAHRSVSLEVTPLVTWRDHHDVSATFEPRPNLRPCAPAPMAHGLRARFPAAEAELRMLWDGDAADPASDWLTGLRHRAETARGLPDRTDVLAAGRFRTTLEPDRAATLVLTIEHEPPAPPDDALAAAAARDAVLLAQAQATEDPVLACLVLAADAFLVRRAIPKPDGSLTDGRTILAGYPWFADWGRDTMIALPGICLATGRHAEAREILTSFARFVADGLLPNNFPDEPGEEPGRNTVDASLWYVHAVEAYERVTGDRTLVDALLPTLCVILDRHLAGTRHGIRADHDGLLRAGEPGTQLTWMDARVDGREITPRIGKPVEIQALWIQALRLVAGWCRERGERGAARYLATADRATVTFRARFQRPDVGHLADVVDGPDGDDWTVRPNQVIALAVGAALVEPQVARSVLAAVRRELETPVGLRSLAPSEPGYAGRFNGPAAWRDAGYHQGTVWAWLIGPYVDAVLRFGGPGARERAHSILAGVRPHLEDAGLGSVGEVFDGDPPHDPFGCPWQAWSVGEVLRAWRVVRGERAGRSPGPGRA